MKKLFLSLLFIAATCLSSPAQVNYDDWFTADRMRLDMVLTGNAREQSIWLESVNFEKKWSGTKENLIYPFDYGEYRMEVFDKASGKLIYSTGFSTLFFEWRTTDEAKKLGKAFSHSFRFPYPKAPVTVTFSERLYDTGKMSPLASFDIDPSDKAIIRENFNDLKVVEIQNNGDINKKVDIVFIADGYTAEQMPDFIDDVKRMTEYLFTLEPYKSRRSDFNVWAVESVSAESGPDIPHHDKWSNTIVESSFYTFYIDRYLTVTDQKSVAKLAANAPCDALYVITNTEKYGGGGIFNSYALCASDSKWNEEVMIHEFGHSFAGLGDEYYESEVAYNDMYNLKVECWEPNITTMVDFDKKWKDMMGKEGVGLHEGGGYASKGIFRPREECRMKSNHGAPDFCPVCRRTISRMIDYFCK